MTNKQIDEFLAEIGRIPLLTHEEELVLLKAVQENGVDCDEMKLLEKANMRFIVSLINQYQNRGLTFGELINVATAGVRMAAEQYDFAGDEKFIAHAVGLMRQQLEQAISERKLRTVSITMSLKAQFHRFLGGCSQKNAEIL